MHKASNKSTPIFMGHGTSDDVVPIEVGQLARDTLINKLDFESVSWNEYPRLGHSVSPKELDDLFNFIENVLPCK